MTEQTEHLVRLIGARLAQPGTAPAPARAHAGWQQSLARGIPGIALLHIELAATGRAPWQHAHDWLTAAAAAPLTVGADSHPFHGGPALAHALACATEQQPGAYHRALHALDEQIIIDTERRLAAAHHRIDQRQLPEIAEYDVIRGLTGYGAYLLRRHPDTDTLHGVLDYLVRLTRPITHDGEKLPGWWTLSGPSGRPDPHFAGGHANAGVAHGIAGPLSLLALAKLKGVEVYGQHNAMGDISWWLDRWATPRGRGPAWPYWITRDELRARRPAPAGPSRPSWCYGAAGQARAQQLASLARKDDVRQFRAETALLNALTDSARLAATTDISLCHGYAGLAHLTARAASDALPDTRDQLKALIPGLLDAVVPPDTTAVAQVADALLQTADGNGAGFLDGAAGVALAVLAADTGQAVTRWDACLLTA
ncbi:lanthionine synthetase C family protein [Streptomyces sp. NPDC085665]|uniref:lanthionine synthetase C family protein n=1 Tax=Streptomyces sp. NPDC085665 TaxID=3365735 RepID=UPI0037CCEBFA